MRVTRTEAAVDAGRLDGDLGVRSGRVRLVELDRARDVGERAANVGDHEVLGREQDVGVGWVDRECRHGKGASVPPASMPVR